ncbi:hypothetical protein [Virgisporangium ochraceum]|uniref:Uncharacterized protein n=1 Tax=Virgisporangium ochraceum TaxID=65505 RepID=A0A8J3ZY93_9ACTN|nr:hypothetical protein [Virgisporangium ochraceum]GIJ70433.1 hypothetical protein Voc01_053500 [Virgisporangium ochraceum]
MAELEHPSWCDPAHCTATTPRPEYRAGETGYHRSAPVTLDHIPNVGDAVFDPDLNPLVAHLAQPAPPWDPVTTVNIGTALDPQVVSLAAGRARTTLRQLDALVARDAGEP